jgi:urocanate hydratase
VMGGVARRAWARNQNAIETALAYNKDHHDKDHITLPFVPDEEMVEKLVADRIPD